MAVGAVRFQVACDCSGETEPGFDVIEASLPWLVGGLDDVETNQPRLSRAAEGRDSLSHWQLFTVTARTKYIGQREGTLLVELVICVEVIKAVAVIKTQRTHYGARDRHDRRAAHESFFWKDASAKSFRLVQVGERRLRCMWRQSSRRRASTRRVVATMLVARRLGTLWRFCGRLRTGGLVS